MRAALKGAWIVAFLFLGACGGARHPDASKADKPKSPEETKAPVASPAPLSYEERLGQATFRHYCQTCHGETGAGDGFNAFNLDPHPRDLSDPVFQKKTDADLRDAIVRGGAGVGLSPLMPPWGRTLSGRQIDDVVSYLRTLRKSP
ncbi:MAG TPA: cytochrome c [Candidatus Polarisedimenticolia bacterium]|nr:cytochrome c [Candidatus Polarisedimenticolia bacterium]